MKVHYLRSYYTRLTFQRLLHLETRFMEKTIYLSNSSLLKCAKPFQEYNPFAHYIESRFSDFFSFLIKQVGSCSRITFLRLPLSMHSFIYTGKRIFILFQRISFFKRRLKTAGVANFFCSHRDEENTFSARRSLKTCKHLEKAARGEEADGLQGGPGCG